MSKAVQQSLASIATRWPADKMRPTLQFSEAIKSASERMFEGGRELSGKELEAAQRGVASLERLLEGKAAKAVSNLIALWDQLGEGRKTCTDASLDPAREQYPLTDKTMKPASFPNHYSRMKAAIDRAERGEVEKKGWFSWLNFRWS